MFIEPHGIMLLHWWNEVGLLLKAIRDQRIALFVEIGILHGGLSRILMDQCVLNPGFRYVGMELDGLNINPQVCEFCDQTPGTSLLVDDAHSDEAVEMVREMVRQTTGPAFVYCDGGDKPKEARLYWPTLRPGDFIGVHDYGPVGEPGIEVFPDDVRQILEEGDLFEMAGTRILMARKR